MATKTLSRSKSKSKSYEVDYKAAIAEIKKLEQKLMSVRSNVSIGSKVQIDLHLAVMKMCEALCKGGGARRMSKIYE